MKKSVFLGLIALCVGCCSVYAEKYLSDVWKADLGNGKYQNPIIYADYSDPDVCLGQDGFYMTASSFNCVPGLPVLYSQDLVNWRIVSHALPLQYPVEHFSKMQHGNGVWAPSIRYHDNTYYIYWGDPDFGIYMIKAEKATGPWSEPVLVKAGIGLIDACPLWDDDGRAYLSFALAGSRAGLKSVLLMTEMTYDGTKAIGPTKIIYDGHEENPTIEGTKLYKHEGRYYIFSPAGGVATGWQEVLRADAPFGPWECRTVMHQGKSMVNGPHQGGWVRTSMGEDWFIHFQDVGVPGRIIHLNPMVWKDGWPVIGIDKDGDGIGEPVKSHVKPKTQVKVAAETPIESDKFDSSDLGLQWQWQANPSFKWWYMHDGKIRLYSYIPTEAVKSLWDYPNLLLQKMPAPALKATAKVNLQINKPGERAGLVVMGMDYALLAAEYTDEGLFLVQNHCLKADRAGLEKEIARVALPQKDVYLRVTLSEGKNCQFSYSFDGKNYQSFGEKCAVREGKWIGAKLGLFCTRSARLNDGGWMDVDYFRITK